jgi:DDB1- and CUL4-associated factor 1
LCREDNNRLVPIILNRLQSYYTQFCEENEINQSTQPSKDLSIDQTNDDTEAPSPKRKSNLNK